MDGINAAIAMAAAKLNNILACPKREGSDKGDGEDKKEKRGGQITSTSRNPFSTRVPRNVSCRPTPKKNAKREKKKGAESFAIRVMMEV